MKCRLLLDTLISFRQRLRMETSPSAMQIDFKSSSNRQLMNCSLVEILLHFYESYYYSFHDSLVRSLNRLKVEHNEMFK